jgi:hypothetical protein
VKTSLQKAMTAAVIRNDKFKEELRVQKKLSTRGFVSREVIHVVHE